MGIWGRGEVRVKVGVRVVVVKVVGKIVVRKARLVEESGAVVKENGLAVRLVMERVRGIRGIVGSVGKLGIRRRSVRVKG